VQRLSRVIDRSIDRSMHAPHRHRYRSNAKPPHRCAPSIHRPRWARVASRAGEYSIPFSDGWGGWDASCSSCSYIGVREACVWCVYGVCDA
jgi:hypothetical protein